MRIGLAFRIFFKILFDADFASRVTGVLEGSNAAVTDQVPARRASSSGQPAKKASNRSDAITLLATLQREARFVDMIKEPLGDYNDAQIGAAARDVLRDCDQVLDRLFGLAPLVQQEEGSPVQVPEGYDAGCYRLTGNVSGVPPFQGKLVHHGWIATRCELPSWSGSERAQRVVAPEEVEIP